MPGAGGDCVPHFFSASTDLCNSLALLARRLCTEFVCPDGLVALLGNRHIALDKSPGVHPIGIREISQHIIAKAVLSVVGGGGGGGGDIQEAAGSIQLCFGRPLA